MSIIVEDEGVPHFTKNDAEPKSLSAPCLPSRALDRGGRLPAEALRHGGSQERELFDPGFDEGSKPSKASPAKVNLACRFMGGH
jgi:hypothetical protein